MPYRSLVLRDICSPEKSPNATRLSVTAIRRSFGPRVENLTTMQTLTLYPQSAGLGNGSFESRWLNIGHLHHTRQVNNRTKWLSAEGIPLMNEAYLFDAGWLFLAGWSAVILAVSLVAFGHDLISSPPRERQSPESPSQHTSRTF